jgi:hypothetical protein
LKRHFSTAVLRLNFEQKAQVNQKEKLSVLCMESILKLIARVRNFKAERVDEFPKFSEQKRPASEFNIQRVLGRCETFELRIFVAFAARRFFLFALTY